MIAIIIDVSPTHSHTLRHMHITLREVSTPKIENPIGGKIFIYKYIFETAGFLLSLFLWYLRTALSH